ncbi:MULTISPECIES: DNA repair exonuclease [unclassified Chelatococcus]|uniref:metallophosphoesterase family protein n=1 Tax=unclassified Chelatococcus TaxID=2638111 RepID=UPI001BCEEBE3|nr:MULTISPECIES: DNA repair exonuclease [unclassified Chelatococcus]MBS7695979.1 DNA repair exonuclease [Chelatococcus sp. YT9]MBX3555646.1 DNA repair exonuclease [Chelatococcus sp.]
MSVPSFQFLHAADLHLDSPLRGLSRRGELAGAFVDASRQALDNLVTAAISEQVAFLIIAGDIYDGDWRDYATGQFFVRQMGRLAQANIPAFLIRGNHDADSVITRNLPLPTNVYLFSVRSVATTTIEPLRVALHGRGFANRHVPDNVALTYPPALAGYFNIGVLHTSLTGRDGHDVYAPCSIEDLQRAGYDYWALGHIHRREVVSEHPFVVFPGNLQGRHARETGEKGATLVTVTEGRVTALEALTLDAARFDHESIDLGGITDMPAFMATAREAIARAHARAGGRPLALRLLLSGQTPLNALLHAQANQVDEDMQAVAWEIGPDILIEKVRVETSGPQGAAGRAALGDFAEMLSAAAADPSFRAEIAKMLADLRMKAPVDAAALVGWTDQEEQVIGARAIEAAEETILSSLSGVVLHGGELS